jgi:uncharacterized membrane protein
MARIERSIIINRPWNAVDAIALDGQRIPEWFAGVEDSEPEGGYPNVGGSVRLAYKAGPMSFSLTQTVLEYVPGNYILFKIDSPMVKGTSKWSHTAQAGGTKLTNVLEYETAGGGLGAIADRLLLERMNTEQMEKSLEKLKKMAES